MKVSESKTYSRAKSLSKKFGRKRTTKPLRITLCEQVSRAAGGISNLQREAMIIKSFDLDKSRARASLLQSYLKSIARRSLFIVLRTRD